MIKDSKREKKNIFELIEELCPDGVEYRRLGECCKIETGRLNANAAVEDGEYPFFTTAQEISHIDSYRWDTEALMIAGNANVGDVKYYNGKFNAYQRTYVLTDFIGILMPRFLFYVMKNNLKSYLEDHKHEAAMTYIVLGSLQAFEIPVPPLAVQREAVRVLDTMTELTTELTAELTDELTARTKQYAYYREELLKLECVEGVKYRKLGECCNILDNKRKPVRKDSRTGGHYPYYGANGIQDYVDGYLFDGQYVLIGEDGSVMTKDRHPVVNYAEGKIWVNNHAHIIEANGVTLLRYLFHYLQTVDISGYVHGNIPKFTGKDLKSLEIPIPPLSVQQDIVTKLDAFSSYCTNLTTGLPAEIEARNKQYAYYRDLLLSFSPAQHSLF